MKTEAELPVMIQIKYNAIPGAPRTWDDEGYDAEIEILDLKIFGEEISASLFDKIMKSLKAEITEKCEEEEIANAAADAQDEADWRRDSLEDR